MDCGPRCYIVNCPLQPVFKCNCQENTFTCQKHCFGHMQDMCIGKLEPFISVNPGKSNATSKSSGEKDGNKRFEVMPSCELMTTLFPGEAAVYQCTMCGKLVPKSLISGHLCERNDITVLTIGFHRESYNKYMCLKCNKIVHSTFIYPHADLHNNQGYPPITKEEISYLTSLIIKNDNQSWLKNDMKEKGLNKQSTKAIEHPYKIQKKPQIPCLNNPFGEVSSMPSKRTRSPEESSSNDSF